MIYFMVFGGLMSLADYKNELKFWTDNQGFVHPTYMPEPGHDQNAIRFTAEAYYLLYKYGDLPAESFRSIMKEAEIEKGLYKRGGRDAIEQIGPDDLILLSAVSFLIGENTIAKNIYEYGIKHFHIFNNTDPGYFTFSAWMGRFPAWRAHLKFCAGVKPNFLELWLFKIAMRYTMKSYSIQNQDAWVFSYFMLLVASYREPNIRPLFQEFQDALKAQLGEASLKQVLGSYYQKPDYPVVKYWF